jgi:release factor glutamine methyltransferase
MTVDDWLSQATREMDVSGIGTPRLDALVLLEDVTGINRARLLAEPEQPLTSQQTGKLTKLLNRRVAHEPLAYIRGFTEFYGRKFVITSAVLEPRPESETMIDMLKELIGASAGPQAPLMAGTHQQSTDLAAAPNWRIADVGTGSGALGITAALELPNSRVDLLEIDPEALKIAQVNVDKFTLLIPTIHSDLLASGRSDYQILLCNLPYVPDSYQINQAASREPALAIFGGPDGLELYRQLFAQITGAASRPLFILTESLPLQHPALAKLAEHSGYIQQREDDFIQLFARQ